MFRICLFVLVLVHHATSDALFQKPQKMGTVTNPDITEPSGAVMSRVHTDVMYLHNDDGDNGHSRLFAVDVKTGKTVAEINLVNATHQDWEDVAYGPCVDDCATTTCDYATIPSRYCIYVGDFGHASKNQTVFMIREPSNIDSMSETVTQIDTDVVQSFPFSYTETEAETLLISPEGKLYVVSKFSAGRGFIINLPTNNPGNNVDLDMGNTATLKITTGHHDPQGGDISPDGTEILFILEDGALHYSVANNDYIGTVRNEVPVKLSNFHRIPNTQSIAWAKDGTGFYVIAGNPNASIYFYPKTATDPIIG